MELVLLAVIYFCGILLLGTAVLMAIACILLPIIMLVDGIRNNLL